MLDLSTLGRDLTTEQGFRRAPTHLWQPAVCGDIDIRIDAQGQWFHEGDMIRRTGLVRLLASILTFDGTDYWLITPVEKMRILVEDLPFIVVELVYEAAGLKARTNVGEQIALAEPWDLSPCFDGEWRPCIQLGQGLGARLSRNLYYDLVHQASASGIVEEQRLVWQSHGMKLPLGLVE